MGAEAHLPELPVCKQQGRDKIFLVGFPGTELTVEQRGLALVSPELMLVFGGGLGA